MGNQGCIGRGANQFHPSKQSSRSILAISMLAALMKLKCSLWVPFMGDFLNLYRNPASLGEGVSDHKETIAI